MWTDFNRLQPTWENVILWIILNTLILWVSFLCCWFCHTELLQQSLKVVWDTLGSCTKCNKWTLTALWEIHDWKKNLTFPTILCPRIQWRWRTSGADSAEWKTWLTVVCRERSGILRGHFYIGYKALLFCLFKWLYLAGKL